MSYRKIIVEGKEYEYVIGNTHVKIKGLGAVDIVQIIEHSDVDEEWIKYHELNFVISPSVIKRVILTKELYKWN